MTEIKRFKAGFGRDYFMGIQGSRISLDQKFLERAIKTSISTSPRLPSIAWMEGGRDGSFGARVPGTFDPRISLCPVKELAQQGNSIIRLSKET